MGNYNIVTYVILEITWLKSSYFKHLTKQPIDLNVENN